jgi:hypothetical protein
MLFLSRQFLTHFAVCLALRSVIAEQPVENQTLGLS